MKFFYHLVFSTLSLVACQQTPKSATSKTGTTRFERLSSEKTGLRFVPTLPEDYVYNFLKDPYLYNGGGVAVLDFDKDGWQDLFFTNRLQGCRLYRNLGGLRFEDVSEKSGVAKASGLKTGATVVDIDADGDPDLYVCRTWLTPLPERRNLLFINKGDGTFSDEAANFGLDDLSASQQANFFDFDGDGDLDCYLMNHPTEFRLMNNLDFVSGGNVASARAQGPRDEFESDRLYRNDGGKFSDISRQAGIWNRAFGLSTLVADFNDDARPDLYVGNDFVMPDFTYINKEGKRFSEQNEQFFRHTSNHSMGSDAADFDNDGLLDLVTLDMLAPEWARRKRLMSTMNLERDRKMTALGYGRQVMRNTLQRNNGNGTFSEIGCLAGVFATDWSWSVLAADFDNDGWRDLFISNGIKRDLNDLDFFLYTADSINRTGGVSPTRFPNFEAYTRLLPSNPTHNYCFQNRGDWQFADVSSAWGFDDKAFSNGAAYADLDKDGDLDLITNNLESPAAIYENKATQTSGNHWLQIRCQGTAQNPFGIGAKVRVFAGGRLVFSQEMSNVRGYYSSVEAVWQVGLGKNTQVEHLEIEWPGGTKHQILENLPADQAIVLNIQDAKNGRLPAEKGPKTLLFSEISGKNGLVFRHQENAFEDFDRERLLPYRLSSPGPCLAVGDMDGDGAEDVFVGGATGQAGALFRQGKNGQFSRTQQPALEADKDFEDSAALFFDADGDGDADLYVSSGGNEAAPESGHYQDRLYKNDGKGHFSRDAAALPKETSSGHCVRAFDFDRDGDLDLCAGGRVVPGRFPETPQSLLLRNEKGVFQNLSATLAPAFERCGMLSDLQWADFDGDGQAELLVAGDWMPLRVFRWEGQQLVEVTARFGLEKTNGLWNCLTISDLDGDGDLDFVAGNQGLNTRFRANAAEPLQLFAADFDKNGSLDPILAVFEKGQTVPVAPRDLLAMQMAGFVKKKFPRYGPYAAASMAEIFGAENLQTAQQLRVEMLASAWFENKNGRFDVHFLPNEAQIAPIARVLVHDFDGDGQQDLLSVGNDYTPEPETYRLDASNGCFLRGEGQGRFSAVPARLSGFWATLEARDVVFLKKANGQSLILVGNNDAELQVFTEGK